MFIVSLIVVFIFYLNICDTLRWRDLTLDEMTLWYSPFDICLMNSTDKGKSPQEIRRTRCEGLSRKINGKNGYCHVGMGSNKKECSPPYSGRTSYRRGIDGYTNASKKYLVRAFKRFSAGNTDVLFLGDSTMTQKRMAMDCEILRETKKVFSHGSLNIVLPCHTTTFYQIPKLTEKIGVHGVSFGPSSLNCLHNSSKTMLYNKRLWTEPKNIIELARRTVKKLNSDGKSLFIVANMGLWYNDRVKLENSVDMVLDWLLEVSQVAYPKNYVFWHETMSQHWPNTNDNGYFDKELGILHKKKFDQIKNAVDDRSFHVPGCCVAIKNNSIEADWRNHVFNRRLSSEKYRNAIRLIRFAKLTEDVADMHVCSQGTHKQDCTHYCYWPLLWQYFWSKIEFYSREIHAIPTGNESLTSLDVT